MNKNVCIGLFIVLLISVILIKPIEGYTEQQRNSKKLHTVLSETDLITGTSNDEIISQSKLATRNLHKSKNITQTMGEKYLKTYHKYRLAKDGTVFAIQNVIDKNREVNERQIKVSNHLKNNSLYQAETNDTKIKAEQYNIDLFIWGIIVISLGSACMAALFTSAGWPLIVMIVVSCFVFIHYFSTHNLDNIHLPKVKLPKLKLPDIHLFTLNTN